MNNFILVLLSLMPYYIIIYTYRDMNNLILNNIGHTSHEYNNLYIYKPDYTLKNLLI